MSLPILVTPLDRHRAALAGCRRCALGPGVVPVVSEPVAPRAMLVGQAPGKSEVASGKPFLGPAGRTLFRWFAAAGLDEATVREHLYIAAITRCYPGPHPAGRGDRVPTPAERAACAGWLDAELGIIRPRLLIPVGRLAIDRFLGPRPLAELVGRVHEVEHVGGRSLAIPLPHPSGASGWLNDPTNRALLDRAIGHLADAAARGAVVPPAAASDRRSVA
jgi:uracil-DNA glycosylase